MGKVQRQIGQSIRLFAFVAIIATIALTASAVGIVEKIICFLFLVPSSMLSAVSALGAQNLGAGKPERAKQTLFWAIGLACGFGAVTVVAMQFLAEALVGLFTPDQAAMGVGGMAPEAFAEVLVRLLAAVRGLRAVRVAVVDWS